MFLKFFLFFKKESIIGYIKKCWAINGVFSVLHWLLMSSHFVLVCQHGGREGVIDWGRWRERTFYLTTWNDGSFRSLGRTPLLLSRRLQFAMILLHPPFFLCVCCFCETRCDRISYRSIAVGRTQLSGIYWLTLELFFFGHWSSRIRLVRPILLCDRWCIYNSDAIQLKMSIRAAVFTRQRPAKVQIYAPKQLIHQLLGFYGDLFKKIVAYSLRRCILLYIDLTCLTNSRHHSIIMMLTYLFVEWIPSFRAAGLSKYCIRYYLRSDWIFFSSHSPESLGLLCRLPRKDSYCLDSFLIYLILHL